jgi:hypothetical protein
MPEMTGAEPDYLIDDAVISMGVPDCYEEHIWHDSESFPYPTLKTFNAKKETCIYHTTSFSIHDISYLKNTRKIGSKPKA